MYIKTMKYQLIINDIEYKEFNKIIWDLQKDTMKILNKTIQILWEYSNFSIDFKNINNIYPKFNEVCNTYKTIDGFIYDRLKHEFNKIGSDTLNQTIQKGIKKWKTSQKDIIKGKKSILSFRNNQPIVVGAKRFKVYKDMNDYFIEFCIITKKYAIELGRKTASFTAKLLIKDGTQKAIVNRIINGEYKIGNSEIMYHKGKWFINLTYKFEKQDDNKLDVKNVMGIDMGIVYPVYIAFNNSLKRYCIEGKQIEEFRRRVEKRKVALQRQGKHCGKGRIGHGRKTRNKPLENIGNKISNFRDTINHQYSKRVVDIAIKNNCGVIQMEDLTGIAKENVFLKNWSYYDLQQKIKYKAEEKGIIVRFINPRHTSQKCSVCGHIDSENRKTQSQFKCVSCGFEANADYNAARNIAITI